MPVEEKIVTLRHDSTHHTGHEVAIAASGGSMAAVCVVLAGDGVAGDAGRVATVRL